MTHYKKTLISTTTNGDETTNAYSVEVYSDAEHTEVLAAFELHAIDGADIDAEVADFMSPYEEPVLNYSQKRQAEYPSVKDQLDKIFHEGIDAWKAEIQAIKDQFPKPSS